VHHKISSIEIQVHHKISSIEIQVCTTKYAALKYKCVP